MKIKILCVGKIKENSLTNLIEEYLKRLSKYTNVEVIELKEVNLKSLSEKDILNALVLEGKNILNCIKKEDYVISLCVEGKAIDSLTFANRIGELRGSGKDIIFVIGSSYGLSEEVKCRSDLKLSFSKMTFPHQLMRLILLEQIYRSFKIINRETYHK